MTKFRLAVFEFLAAPAFLWVHVAALLVGFRWVMVRDEGDEELPNCDHVPQRIRSRKDGDRQP